MADESKPRNPANILAQLMAGSKPWSWTWRYHSSLYDHMHALGVVAANYNHLEFVFLLLFNHHMRSHAAATVIFANLNNRYRKDVMQALLDDQEHDPIIRDR